MAPEPGRIRCGTRRIEPGPFGARTDGARPRDAGQPRRATAIREPDPATALVRALDVRANGGVPVIGDDRWPPELAQQLTSRLDASAIEDGAAWGTFTSGSTGRPRTVLRTAASWERSFAAVTSLLGLRSDDVVYAPAPLVSSLSMFAAVHAITEGADIRLPVGHTFGASDLRDSTILHGTPFALELALDAIEAGHPSTLRVALIGGDRIPGGLRERAGAVGLQVIGYYGAAELSFVALDQGKGLRAFPGVELRVRDGVVWVRSEYVALGYLSGQAGPLEFDDGWATVGDRASIDEDGTVALGGRGDGAIITAGATVIPGDVEKAIRRLAAVRDVAVLGISHARAGAIVAAVIECPEGPPSRRELRATVAAGLGLAQRPRRWYWGRSLPRTASGKLDRAAIAAAVEEGEFDTL